MRAWLALLLLAACGGHSHTSAGPDEYVIDCETLPDAGSGGSFASDESYDAFVNAAAAGKVTMDAARAPHITSPSGTISAVTPPSITFTPTGGSAKPLVLPHCGAFSGENYLLELVKAGDADPVYMSLLSVTSYTPDAEIWKKALSGRSGQTLTLTIQRAIFLRGDIMEGPYVQPTGVSLQVGP